MEIKRSHSGYYEVTEGVLSVVVLRNPELRGPAKWIAYANWGKYVYTDPVMTKREAKGCAEGMIRDRLAEEKKS